MAAFLPVAPANYLQKLLGSAQKFSQEPLPPNAFLLAHEVVADPEGYAKAQECWAGKPGIRILDNSVIELGGAVDLKMVASAQEIVKANVVVLPDVLEDSQGTFELASRELERWAMTISDAELMFVPQGETLNSWIWCLEKFIDFSTKEIGMEPHWIGIPRNTTKRIVASRRELVDIVRTLAPYADIHLLGFSDYLYDDVISAQHPAVSSIDSAVPFRTPELTLSGVVPKRGTWWEDAKLLPQGAIPDWAVENVWQLNDWVAAK